MATRGQAITPFQTSMGPSTEHDKKPDKVKVNANMSDVRNSGTEGALHAALSHRGMPEVPSDRHIWTHTTRVEPVGAHYTPHGEFGKRQATGTGRGVYSYGGAPNRKGDNPLGSPPDRKGDNPLGRAMNRVGGNAVGKPPNRRGGNAVGSNSNRTGEKSGYGKFRPTGGGKNV